MKKQVRTGKVFVDWSQNDEHKTTIAVYSLRAREHPTASTPVTWEEVERALKKKDANLLVFEAKQVVARVEKMGDLFAPVLELKQRLPRSQGGCVGSGAEQSRLRRRRKRNEDAHRRSARRSGEEAPGAQAETQGIIPSAAISSRACHAATFCRNFGMGVSELEA